MLVHPHAYVMSLLSYHIEIKPDTTETNKKNCDSRPVLGVADKIDLF